MQSCGSIGCAQNLLGSHYSQGLEPLYCPYAGRWIPGSRGCVIAFPRSAGNDRRPCGCHPLRAEENMANDKSKKGMQDRDRINVNEDYELRGWAKKFGVT